VPVFLFRQPANIFLTLNGTVKVGDLGLGRLFSDATVEAFSKARCGVFDATEIVPVLSRFCVGVRRLQVGTPLYMSPEVLKGKGYEFKSDVWSCGYVCVCALQNTACPHVWGATRCNAVFPSTLIVGRCILYELAMLRSPFKEEGLNLYGLFGKISKGEYPPISEVYSRELRELVDQMLIIDPVKRLDMDVRAFCRSRVGVPPHDDVDSRECSVCVCCAGCVRCGVKDANSLHEAP
jgi:NIMA (never in mitosis gene a)-related kinase 1/4/5